MTTARSIRIVLTASLVLSGALIAASQLGARTEAAAPAAAVPPPRAAAAARPFAGIPQHGAVLGSATAPVTLVEYADLQCPYCAEWARRTLPVLVADYVRSGKLRIVFNGLAFVGPDSQRALRTAVAAGRHDRLWDVVDTLYLTQGVENSGWITDASLADLAAGVGLDPGGLAAESGQPWVASQIAASARAATAAGVRGTPSFQLGPTGRSLRFFVPASLGPEGTVPAIEAVVNRG